MKIKSLLLGSAAALAAVSGARAADAVMMAAPEPVEYVRVCDAYGTGFFYIPGTETCLRFDGYVRYQVNMQDTYDGRLDGWGKTYRTRLNVDARSDTEWGTLRGFMRFQADGPATETSQDGSVGIDQAIVQLGGFYAGYTESAFAAPWGVPGIARFGILHTDGGGNYAYHQVNQMGYTFSGGNGLFGSVVLEDDVKAGDTYVPNIVGVIGMSQGWGGVWLKGGYDESADEGGIVAGVHYNIPNMAGSSLRAGVFWASGDGLPDSPAPGSAVGNVYAVAMPLSGNAAEWSIAGSYHQQFTSAIGAEIGAQYMEDFASGDGYLIQAAVIWVPVTNFEIRLEGHYNQESSAFTANGDDNSANGFIRFARYF